MNHLYLPHCFNVWERSFCKVETVSLLILQEPPPALPTSQWPCQWPSAGTRLTAAGGSPALTPGWLRAPCSSMLRAQPVLPGEVSGPGRWACRSQYRNHRDFSALEAARAVCPSLRLSFAPPCEVSLSGRRRPDGMCCPGGRGPSPHGSLLTPAFLAWLQVCLHF